MYIAVHPLFYCVILNEVKELFAFTLRIQILHFVQNDTV